MRERGKRRRDGGETCLCWRRVVVVVGHSPEAVGRRAGNKKSAVGRIRRDDGEDEV
jgi:hypothetical protein